MTPEVIGKPGIARSSCGPIACLESIIMNCFGRNKPIVEIERVEESFSAV